MSSEAPVRGSCLCRSVSWEAKRPFTLMSHCHCSMCRKTHGSAFGTYVAAPAEGFRWLQGEDQIVVFRSSEQNDRCFCKQCGSVVPSPVQRDEHAWMPAGCLDEDPGARPLAHIFVASKAPWYPLPDDGLHRFDAYPPTFPSAAVERAAQPVSEAGWVGGSCLCGEIAFEFTTGGWTLMQCHCSRCRKARSTAHGANLFVEDARFRWLRGQANVQNYKVPEAARFAQAFCGRCGSKMPRAGTGRYVVPAGSVDGDPGIAARRHIFTGSKAPWFTIADSHPQDETYPPQ